MLRAIGALNRLAMQDDIAAALEASHVSDMSDAHWLQEGSDACRALGIDAVADFQADWHHRIN